MSIAAYRDRELPRTVADCLKRASRPDAVAFGICWQGLGPEESAEGLGLPARGVRLRCYDSRDSRGACWARNVAHGLRRGEEFTLQTDSHMRFHDGWDDDLLAMSEWCGPRSVLSTYPASYEPPDDLQACGTYALMPRRFDRNGILSFRGAPIVAPAPVPSAWLAGGFMFAPSAFFDEVPYDPAVYFLGEEASLAARGWTRGWDYYAPHRCVMHHYYVRRVEPKHWGDNGSWARTDDASVRRVRHLLGVSRSGDPSVVEGLDGPMGLGSARSLWQFEQFAGVSFRRQRIDPR